MEYTIRTPDILDSYTHQLASNKQAEMTGGTVTPWMETLLAAKKKYMEDPRPENAWIYNEGSTTNMTWVANNNLYENCVKTGRHFNVTTFLSAADLLKHVTTFLWVTSVRKVCMMLIPMFKNVIISM